MTSYVVLLRHGAAVSKEVNPDRPLDTDGIIQASTAGIELSATLSGYGIKQVRVLHSKHLRAQQTAEFVAKELNNTQIASTVGKQDGLCPNDPPDVVLQQIKRDRPPPSAALILVGHLPQLHLLSQLMEFDLLKESDFPDAGGLLVQYPDIGDEDEEWELLRQFDVSD
eukprot:CAMPEP_0114263752 /NCGR_PEP_ID=MMETSP0058-20121206/22735_1 /TAXON_ID=36894 /ORGANISM="Pyramimonas parkeae, CCMP726" /LENGTH=167 /DNA_ID=CAMNT_0001380169 /DNA_START=66 /DNA_END=569 /DNA_ORIENTATION=-